MVHNPKIYALEDREDIDKMTMDELDGILTTYEMRIGQNNTQKGESTLKISKESKNQEQGSNNNIIDIR